MEDLFLNQIKSSDLNIKQSYHFYEIQQWLCLNFYSWSYKIVKIDFQQKIAHYTAIQRKIITAIYRSKQNEAVYT